MSKIKEIKARQLIDCKCRPMVEVDVITEKGSLGRGSAPTGSSVGMYESFVLRDNDPKEYNGMSVHKAVENVNKIIAPALVGKEVSAQDAIDKIMIELDGTPKLYQARFARLSRSAWEYLRRAGCRRQIPPCFRIGR